MDFEDPTDLIRQVQLSLRRDAGLSSYDPQDSNLPSLPSLRDSIAGFDPSPPYLRCKHCHGRLLRGLQSVICGYCGKHQTKDVPPEPIAFKSTFGYQWLLQSLDLDGSETVGPPAEENELNRGQKTPKDEILLSDLLNFEIRWPVESEKPEQSLTENVAAQSKISFSLPGVDLDNFFAESRGDHVANSSEQQLVTNKQSFNVETNAFAGRENLSLFENVQHPVTTVGSSEVKDNNGFSGWEADFQSADSGNQNETSISFDPFVGSSVDLSTYVDSVFVPGKDLEDEKPKEASTPLAFGTNDWTEDDLWNDSHISASHQAEQVDATIKNKDGVAPDNVYTHSSTSIDWFPDDQWQTSSKTAPDNKTINEDDDSFDVWNDFTSSTNAQCSSKNSLKQNDNRIAAADEQPSDVMISISTNNFEEMDFGSFSQPDLFSEAVSNQNSSVEVRGLQSEVPVLDRESDDKDKVGHNVGVAAKDGDVVDSAIQSKHDVEILLSQMHDLSFMLKSDLSLPSE